MINAYLNYPNSRVEIHCDRSCSAIRKLNKQNQRVVRINLNNVGIELEKFKADYKFGSTKYNNDMWVTVDLADIKFEIEVVKYIRRMLGGRYKPFCDAVINVHCQVA